MACPQKENGYTAIANEVLEKLISFPFPYKTGIPISLCFFVIRKTWGFHKKSDNISLTQFGKGLSSNRPTIVHWLKYLVKANILVKASEPDKKGYDYRFNKDYDSWKWLVKASELVKARVYTSKGALTSTSKGALTHKRNIKDNTKDNIAEQAPLEVIPVNEVIPDLLKDKQKHIQIIGLFARAKKIEFTSLEHQRSFIKRNLRAAQSLSPYTPNRIAEVMKYLLDNSNFKWTLESVGKYADDDLTKINNNSIKTLKL